jgi:CheY-like chemotaxis protein
MFSVLVVDDDFEDRELLKLEIKKAIGKDEADIRFSEAVSIKKAFQLLTTRTFDLMTLDIEFDKMNEGIRVLPELFENYPTLNIIVVSGKLNKSEVLEQLFRFTKENVLKSKRWTRHFDVLDKKDDKTEALRQAYSFTVQKKNSAEKVRELFLLAESYLEKNMLDKCLEIYQRVQDLVPDEKESKENISILKERITPEYALGYYKRGETVVASLILGYCIESQLKRFTSTLLGYSPPVLSDCMRELEKISYLTTYRKMIFKKLLRTRNKAIHHPSAINEIDFNETIKNLAILDETLS